MRFKKSDFVRWVKSSKCPVEITVAYDDFLDCEAPNLVILSGAWEWKGTIRHARRLIRVKNKKNETLGDKHERLKRHVRKFERWIKEIQENE